MEPPYGQDEEFLGQKYEFEGDMSGFEVVQCINYTLVNEHGSTMDRLKMYNYIYIISIYIIWVFPKIVVPPNHPC